MFIVHTDWFNIKLSIIGSGNELKTEKNLNWKFFLSNFVVLLLVKLLPINNINKNNNFLTLFYRYS